MILLAMSTGLRAQNIENIPNEKPFKFSGNISAQMLAYTTTRDNPSRDPFVWTLSGSPTLSIYGINIPFSFTVSQKHSEFSQPFNQFGMSPYYKWLTVHAGYRNVTFSRYTLAGHTFLGGGVEARPGNFRFGFVMGRFMKAVEDDSLNLHYVIPAFRRPGYSVKVGYGTQSNYLDLILFKARDDTTSIGRPDNSSGVLPAENLVLGVKSFQRFLKHFTLDLDFGYSIYTGNLYAGDIGLPDVPMNNLVSKLITINNSTRVSWAGNASLSYTHRVFGLRLVYRRIEPEYQTMGAYFFTNDLEQITVDPSLFLFKRKLMLRGSIGYRKNNLAEDKLNNTFRRIYSLNLMLNPTQQLAMNLSYMNYRIDQSRNPLVIKDFVDSLQMKQVSRNLSVNLNYNFGPGDTKHTISAGTNYQNFIDENNSTEALNSSSSLSPYLSYRLNNRPSNFSVYGRVNYNTFQSVSARQTRLGFTAGGSKRLVDNKISIDVSGTAYMNKIGEEANGTTLMARTRLNYRFFKNHQLNFSMNFINRAFKNDTQNNFNELLIRIGYSLRI